KSAARWFSVCCSVVVIVTHGYHDSELCNRDSRFPIRLYRLLHDGAAPEDDVDLSRVVRIDLAARRVAQNDLRRRRAIVVIPGVPGGRAVALVGDLGGDGGRAAAPGRLLHVDGAVVDLTARRGEGNRVNATKRLATTLVEGVEELLLSVPA